MSAMQQKNAASLMGASTVAGLQRIQWVPATSATTKAEGGSITALGLRPINPPVNVRPAKPSPRGHMHLENGHSNPEDDESILQAVGKGTGIGAGLENLGNTCYLNSTLQCLTYSRPLTILALKRCLRQAAAKSASQDKSGESGANGIEDLSSRGLSGGFRGNSLAFASIGPKIEEHRVEDWRGRGHGEGRGNKTSGGGFCVLRAVEQHISDAASVAPPSVTRPMSIVRHLRQICKHMRVGKQEDAHEFLRYLVEAMHEAAGGDAGRARRKTVVSELFGGQLRSQIVCEGCRKDSNTYEPCLDLSLDVARGREVFRTLDAALRGFCTAERLDGVNKYKCDNCKRLCPAIKLFSLHKPPPLLVIHFKRFGFSLFGGGKKIDTKIDFPLTLDLTSYVTHSGSASGSIYNLYAVLVHAGASTRSGHYYSFVRSMKPGSQDVWYSMDDARVRRVDVQTVLAQRAYILFYERQTVKNGKRRHAITSEHAAIDRERLKNEKLPSLATKSSLRFGQMPGNGIAERHARSVNGDASTPTALLGSVDYPHKPGAQQRVASTVSRSCPRAFDNPFSLKGFLSQCIRTRSYYLTGLRRIRKTRKAATVKLKPTDPPASEQQAQPPEEKKPVTRSQAVQRTSLGNDWSFHQRSEKWEDVDFKLAARHDSLAMKEQASQNRSKRDWWDVDYDRGRQKKMRRKDGQNGRFQVRQLSSHMR